MEISGSYDLSLSQKDVWDAMMDTSVLTDCIPACQDIEKFSDDHFHAKVKVKFGFIPVRFNVNVKLSAISMPDKYSLEAEGEGGLAHAAKAVGNVEFVRTNEHTTRVDFLGEVLPGSKLFELGEPLIQKTASKWFNRFFERFEQVVATDRVGL